MIAYIVRRVLYAIPILIGVNIVTFVLFFFVNTPDDMARAYLGEKRVTEEQIADWKRERDYHFPNFYNDGWTEITVRQVATDTVSFDQSALVAGTYRLVLDVRAEGEGQLDVTIESDETGTTSFEGPWTADTGTDKHERSFELTSVKDELHTLSIDLSPRESNPLVVARLDRKDNLSIGAAFTRTIFWQRSVRFLMFNFGKADDGRNIGDEISRRIGPSLSITIPVFLVGLVTYIFFAMLVAFYRGTYLDGWGVVLAVFLMSVSILFYVIGAQWLLGKILRLAPVSGYDTGLYALKFVVLPIVIGIIGGVGQGVRWYRTIFLEEIGKDYVRTARAKGLPESIVLFRHTLKNAMIPILTGIVVSIPFLFIGSLVLESFFAIPGMGSFMLEAIQRQDFAIVQAMVFLGAFMYVVGLILTDISYTLVDPRIKFS
jgi:peptide/nickel transport system permease protein